MTTRREFVSKAAAGLLLASTNQGYTIANSRVGNARKARSIPRNWNAALKLIRREETTRRLGGRGDNFHMSWAADDRQYVAVCDGTGWFEKPRGAYNSRLFAISGGPESAKFEDVPSYPELMAVSRTEHENRYYGFGTLALDGHIYQFLSTPNHRFFRSDGSLWPDARFVGAKLIYSPDNGRTWCNQDGSTPVVWEGWEDRSRHNMAFFEEPQDAFSLLSILQMGRNYEANRDGYIYVYAPNGSIDGTMNELVMFRVPKAHLLDRSTYEYFAGLKPGGSAVWTSDIDARDVVQNFPRGWVNKKFHPWAWMPSITYNAPLDAYLMASWGTGSTPDGLWFDRPSYLGLWAAQKPWGPWVQFHEETVWMPDRDRNARAFAPQISPKWIAPDGKSFWLVWSDIQVIDEQAASQLEHEINRVAKPSADDQLVWDAKWRRIRPYYAFNAQRVDIVAG